MKLYSKAAFALLPPGTVYAVYRPCYFGDLQIKGETGPPSSWYALTVGSAIAPVPGDDRFVDACALLERGGSVPIDLDEWVRDDFDCGEPDPMFAVWEPDDLEALIAKLHTAIIRGRDRDD